MKYFTIKGIVFIISILFIINSPNFSQTSALGNYRIYTRDASNSAIGYLTTQFTLPDYRGATGFKQHGIMYLHHYQIANLGSININSNNEINFSLRGAFRIGFGMGSDSTKTYSSYYPKTQAKYYSATIDLYSMGIATDYTFILSNGYAIVPRFQIGLIDIGGTVGILNHGVFNQNGFGVITLLPLSFKPSIYIDLGRTSIGIAFLINPYNLIDYRVVPHGLFKDEDNGIQFNDSIAKRYAFQILFNF